MCLVRCENTSLLKPEAVSAMKLINLISSVLFSQFLSAVTYHYTQWRCLVAPSAPLSCLLLHCCHRAFPEAEGGDFHQTALGGAGLNSCFTGQWWAVLGCWVWLRCPRAGIWESLLIPEKLDAEHPRTRWYFVLSISRTCLEAEETEGLSPRACKARSYLDQLYYILSYKALWEFTIQKKEVRITR